MLFILEDYILKKEFKTVCWSVGWSLFSIIFMEKSGW